MVVYGKILKGFKRIYSCEACLVFYQNRKRAERCHEGDVAVFEVIIKRLKDYHKEQPK